LKGTGDEASNQGKKAQRRGLGNPKEKGGFALVAVLLTDNRWWLTSPFAVGNDQ